MENKQPNVFIGVPTANGEMSSEVASALINAAMTNQIGYCSQKLSKSTQNFNGLLCICLNSKRHTHFCMIHADVFIKEASWLPKMLQIMADNKADILSVIMPQKGPKGVTSTGLCKEETYPLVTKRFTMKEVYAMPETFTHEHLVVNTGLMLIDLNAPFMKAIGDGLCFRYTDKIERQADGKLRAFGGPEDWLFSLDARKLGARLFATRAIKVVHCGGGYYSNESAWGVETDDWNQS